MRSDFVVIRGVCFENLAQMRLAENDDVVETFAAMFAILWKLRKICSGN
jgi:hypothetical protein